MKYKIFVLICNLACQCLHKNVPTPSQLCMEAILLTLLCSGKPVLKVGNLKRNKKKKLKPLNQLSELAITAYQTEAFHLQDHMVA